MPKTLITLRASAETIRKIAELARMWETTKSEVLVVAIDRLHQAEQDRQGTKDGS